MKEKNESERQDDVKLACGNDGVTLCSASLSEIPKNVTFEEVTYPGLVAVLHIKGKLERPLSIVGSVQNSAGAAIYCFEGNFLYSARNGQTTLVTKDQALICKEPISSAYFVARGEVNITVVTWNAKYLSPFQAAIPEGDAKNRLINLSAQNSVAWPVYEQLKKKTKNGETITELDILSTVSTTLNAAVNQTDKSNLDTIPFWLEGQLRELLEQVKADPKQNWVLTEAARKSGYSSFHLSRLMRQVSGFGFPRFVERCRLSLILQDILAGDDKFNVILKKGGFSSMNALRKACRENIGLLPSEMRGFATVTGGNSGQRQSHQN